MARVVEVVVLVGVGGQVAEVAVVAVAPSVCFFRRVNSLLRTVNSPQVLVVAVVEAGPVEMGGQVAEVVAGSVLFVVKVCFWAEMVVLARKVRLVELARVVLVV